MRKGKKLVKRCLLHCLRSPHTHYTTLHTGLMLTRGISALWLVLREESSSHTILIFTNAHSKFNSPWLTPTGSSKQYSACRYIVFAAIHDLDKTIAESGIDTCAIEGGAYTSAARRRNYGDNIYMYMGGIEYHIATNLAITIVSLMSLYMWYTKEDSL